MRLARLMFAAAWRFRERDGQIDRFALISAAHLLLIRDGAILLLPRHNTGYADGRWGVVAGHLDGGETARQAMVREASAEAGLQIVPNDLRLVHVMHRGAARERIDLFFEVKEWRGAPINREPQKGPALAWHALERLPPNMAPYIATARERSRRGDSYSEADWPDASPAPGL